MLNTQSTYFDLKSPQTKHNRGAFTRCYRNPNFDYVILYSVDMLKEVYSLWLKQYDENGKNKHLPEIERIGQNWYIMPKYRPLSPKYKKAWEQYRKLVNTAANYRFYNPGYNYHLHVKFAEQYRNIDENISYAMLTLLNCASNATGELYFDDQQANFSVDNDGNLILRDLYVNMNNETLPTRAKITFKTYE